MPPPAASQALSVLFTYFVVYAGKDRGEVLLRIITIKRFIWWVCIQQSQLLSALKAVSKLWMPEYLWAVVYIMEKSLTVIKMIFLHGYCQKFFHNVNHILNMMKSLIEKNLHFLSVCQRAICLDTLPKEQWKNLLSLRCLPDPVGGTPMHSVADLECFIYFS